MKPFLLFSFLACYTIAFGQQTSYDVVAGNGNGIRFWQDDSYKIHMGNGAEYQYGPVTDYSIKMNMSGNTGRGWTWGLPGVTPIAALSNIGEMKIAGSFTTSGNSNPLNFTSLWSSTPDHVSNVSEISNDANLYKQLMIVGNKAQGEDRRVGIWDRLSIDGAGFSQTLNVNGGAYYAGNVGIGTDTPQARLHIVNGDLLLQNQTSGYPILWLKNVSGTNTIRMDYNSIIGAGGNLVIRSGSTNSLVLNDAGGNVGIGTSSPNEKLTVNGTIYGKEVKVDLSVPGPDYVFEKSYNLSTLKEIETFINANKHLPEVPAASEMESKGINLGEMNMLLLKKVEELTLHLIEKEKEIDSLEMRIQKLEGNK